jgi:dienelactone hydrolase
VAARTATRLAAGAAVLLLAACGGSKHAASPQPALFGYDARAPLAAKDLGVINPGYPLPVHNVSYASPKGGRVTAYLVDPPGKQRKPGIVYLHGSGGNRTELLVPAVWMASRGAVTLTVDAPDARHPTPALPGVPGLKQQFAFTVQTIEELRRAVDYLRSRPDVDASRIAFVGISAGARAGAILAGVDHRVKSFVLMSGGAVPISRYTAAAPARLRPPLRRYLGETSPLRWIRRSSPARLLFQDGRRDTIVPRDALLALYRAAGRPKELRWYEAGHTLDEAAYHDQVRWLAARLRLTGPRVAGTPAGP